MTTASVVTFHTGGPELSACLNMLQHSGVDKIWVVDNASEARIAAIAAQTPGAIYIASRNNGYGAAHNIALREAAAAGSRYHLVMNTDVSFTPGAIAEITAYMDAHPDVGMAQPRIVNSSGNPVHSCRMLPTPADLIIRRFLPRRLFAARRDEYLLKHLDPGREHNIPYHQGSFMMLRMQAVKQCGGFDERFFLYPEDIDLTRRIHRRWRTMYIPRPVVVHSHRAASYRSARMLAIHALNICRYFNKWGWWSDPERTRFNAPLKATERHP